MHGYFRDCDSRSSFLFLNDTTSTKLYTLSLHDALPILLTSRSSPADVGEPRPVGQPSGGSDMRDRKSTRLNSSHRTSSYAVFCLKNKNQLRHQWFHDPCFGGRHLGYGR